MEFCPNCGTLLKYKPPHFADPARLFCSFPGCCYVCNIQKKIKRKQPLVKKEIEPVFTKDDRVKGPTIQVSCPFCQFGKAMFHQLQIRSADEGMTTFYWCLSDDCGRLWVEN